jgi:hypothetical protein
VQGNNRCFCDNGGSRNASCGYNVELLCVRAAGVRSFQGALKNLCHSHTIICVRNIIRSWDVNEVFRFTLLRYFCIAVVSLSERMTNNGRQGSCLRLLICDVSNTTATVAGRSAMSDFIVISVVCLLTSVKSEKHYDMKIVSTIWR